MRKLLATLLIAAATFVAAPARAQQAGSGPSNAAVAVNTKDGTDLFKLMFDLYRVVNTAQPQPSNGAAAVSSCDQCSTTAIAIQIVLMMAPVSAPTNIAIAENESCTSCTTIALAYQLIFDVPDKVQLTPEGRKEIIDILGQIAALQNQNLTPDELKAQTDALVGQLATVIANDLRPIGQQTSEDAQVSASPSPTATTEAPPTESPTTTTEPSPSPTPTDTLVPTATP